MKAIDGFYRFGSQETGDRRQETGDRGQEAVKAKSRSQKANSTRCLRSDS
jgi:hypothetical protein